MEKGLYKYYTELPTWAKGILLVSIIGGTVYSVYEINRYVKNKNKEADLKSDVIKLKDKGVRLTFPITDYKGLADKIQQSGLNHLFGTDEDSILSVFKSLKNDLDVLYLLKGFGDNRYASVFNWSSSLPEFLEIQIGKDGVAKVNHILELKSIKYRF